MIFTRFSPLTPECKSERCTSLVGQQFGHVRFTARPCAPVGLLSFLERSLFSLFQLYARGRHRYAAPATRWALPRISSFLFQVAGGKR